MPNDDMYPENSNLPRKMDDKPVRKRKLGYNEWAENDGPIYVFARDALDARVWAKNYGLGSNQWKFIEDATKLKGLRDRIYVRVGAYWAHVQAEFIQRELRDNKFKDVT